MLKKKCIVLVVYILTLLSCFNTILANEVSVNSASAIVMETSSKRILFEKNITDKRKIASTTKLMTAMVVLDNCKLDEIVTVSKKAAGIGGSSIGLRSSENVSVKSLLYGLMLESGNDCAVALAEHVAGNIEEFAAIMNEKAKLLGASNTNYTNPHGLDTKENFCTAYDLALIARETLNYPELQEILSTKEIQVKIGKRSMYMANTNRLLHTYEYCTGGKTGFTNGANMCVVTIAKKDDLQIITVVLGGETSDIRFNDAKQLMQYAFDTYTMVDISHFMNWYVSIPVYKGNIQKYEKYITDNLVLPLKEGEAELIYVKQTLLPIITAPMEKGAILGDIAMYIKSEPIYLAEVRLEQDIPKNNVWYYMKRGIRHIFDVKLELF